MFNSDDKLTLSKQLKFLTVTIVISYVFEDDSKYYPQTFLNDCVYELLYDYDKIDISEGIDINKTIASKECDIYH